MITPKETMYFMEQSNKILELIRDRDDFDNSDFQGAIDAVIISTYREGQKLSITK